MFERLKFDINKVPPMEVLKKKCDVLNLDLITAAHWGHQFWLS